MFETGTGMKNGTIQPNTGEILQISNLHVHFFTRRGEVNAIRGVNLAVKRGEVLGLVGESGCGKSVTSLSLVDLLPTRTGAITDGNIILNGSNVSDLYKKEFKISRSKRRSKIRPDRRGTKKVQREVQDVRGAVSMVFQDPLTSLDPLYRVQTQMLESVLFNNRKTIISRVLEKIDLKKSRKDLLELLPSMNTITFAENIRESFGEYGFYQELLLIIHMNLSEADKKLKISRSINTTPELNERQISNLRKKLKITKRKVKRPRDRKPKSIQQIRDPIRREATLYSLELLEFIDMPFPERVLGLYPHELSGGMKQRVMIGLAIANNPALLIADEPTTSLDVTTQRQILYLLRNLNRELDLTIIFITHDLGVMAAIADRIAVMYSGKICEVGPSKLFFTDPLHPYTKGLLKSIPVEGQKSTKLYTIPGQVPDLLNPPQGCPFAERCESVMEICRDEAPPPVEKDERLVYCWLFGGGPN